MLNSNRFTMWGRGGGARGSVPRATVQWLAHLLATALVLLSCEVAVAEDSPAAGLSVA
jgi:hypothetical protein